MIFPHESTEKQVALRTREVTTLSDHARSCIEGHPLLRSQYGASVMAELAVITTFLWSFGTFARLAEVRAIVDFVEFR